MILERVFVYPPYRFPLQNLSASWHEASTISFFLINIFTLIFRIIFLLRYIIYLFKLWTLYHFHLYYFLLFISKKLNNNLFLSLYVFCHFFLNKYCRFVVFISFNYFYLVMKMNFKKWMFISTIIKLRLCTVDSNSIRWILNSLSDGITKISFNASDSINLFVWCWIKINTTKL
jgi:hypothetical protein